MAQSAARNAPDPTVWRRALGLTCYEFVSELALRRHEIETFGGRVGLTSPNRPGGRGHGAGRHDGSASTGGRIQRPGVVGPSGCRDPSSAGQGRQDGTAMVRGSGPPARRCRADPDEPGRDRSGVGAVQRRAGRSCQDRHRSIHRRRCPLDPVGHGRCDRDDADERAEEHRPRCRCHRSRHLGRGPKRPRRPPSPPRRAAEPERPARRRPRGAPDRDRCTALRSRRAS